MCMYLLQIHSSCIHREYILLEENNKTEKTEEFFEYMAYERAIYLKAYPIYLSISSSLVRDAASLILLDPETTVSAATSEMLLKLPLYLGFCTVLRLAWPLSIAGWINRLPKADVSCSYIKTLWAPNSSNDLALKT